MMDEFINCKVLGPFEAPEAGTCQAFCLVCQAAFALPVVLGLFKSLEKPHKQHSPAQPSTSCPKRQDPQEQAKLMCCSLSPCLLILTY